MAEANSYRFEPDDLVIGFGTSYNTAKTLASMPHCFLNLHTGFLPDFRGVKSEFWALNNRPFDRIGWTLHYMTPGRDEGDMVLRGCVTWNGESPGVLRAKLLRRCTGCCSLDRGCPCSGLRSDFAHTPGRGADIFGAPRLRDWLSWRATCRVVLARKVLRDENSNSKSCLRHYC